MRGVPIECRTQVVACCATHYVGIICTGVLQHCRRPARMPDRMSAGEHVKQVKDNLPHTVRAGSNQHGHLDAAQDGRPVALRQVRGPHNFVCQSLAQRLSRQGDHMLRRADQSISITFAVGASTLGLPLDDNTARA